ncbi:Peptidyl-prolyl cis-trans isomerase [Phaffia rhodozyma]|uniref:Peptidyl-prolyl cis-trans isomerase n=1 Tax=Phaffia rhodozyma TaxID=264483 RepID=A0A0F7SG49_PHARH|nr:Peptidyl-prolyl cis-trans isomerase [Phaffia rhodozyma]
MSNLYIYEPATSGKVVLQTTMGDIEIELWPKEAPKACRNFIAEGYYDNCIFHRIVENFMIQTGDPTGTGYGGESFYGEPFEDEPHQRLKFSRRGLVAMANNNARNTNQSQFFNKGLKAEGNDCCIDRTDELQGKHVAADGNTIFNVLKIGQLETDKQTERPKYPPKIKSIVILDNPFDDIVIRITAEERRKQEARRREREKEEKERREAGIGKKKKNTKLLSFGEEAGEEELEAAHSKKNLARPDLAVSTTANDVPSFDKILADAPAIRPPSEQVSASSTRPNASQAKLEDFEDIRRKADEDNADVKRAREIEAMEASLRNLSNKRARSPSPVRSKGPSMLERELAGYERGRRGNTSAAGGGRNGKRKGGEEEEDILALLGGFRRKMQSARDDSEGAEGGDGEEGDLEVDNDLGWMGHALIDHTDQKAVDETRRAETDYEVIDTRSQAKAYSQKPQDSQKKGRYSVERASRSGGSSRGFDSRPRDGGRGGSGSRFGAEKGEEGRRYGRGREDEGRSAGGGGWSAKDRR